MDYRKRCYQTYISSHFGHLHAFSDREFEHILKIYRKRFSKFLPADKEAPIIDAACGSGYFLYFLSRRGYSNVRGIDLSKEQVEQARKKGIGNIKKADLFKYLLKFTNYFQMIIANDIIEHLKKDEVLQFLNLVYCSLAPGGTVLVSAPNAQSLFGSSTVFVDFTHELGFTPESLSQVLRVSNFEDVAIYGEKPIIYDFRSAIRAGLWWCIENILKLYMTIERGTGRGLWKRYNIFEPRMFAIGRSRTGNNS